MHKTDPVNQKMPDPQLIKNLTCVFEPKSVAVIGASEDAGKIGNVILRNFVEGGFSGKIFPVNPNSKKILGLPCYPTILKIPHPIDCAIIATPAKTVPGIIMQCARKNVKGLVVITGGFGEIGNARDEAKIARIAKDHSISLIGPNCMGVLNPSQKNDSVFLPLYKMGRPKAGAISFLSQSGAVGGCIVDLAARAGVGISKFVSYGNASVIDECDLLEYFKDDEKTEIIIIYLEGVKDGRRFMETARKITPKKPIIALKAGKGKFGSEAAKSHTGSMAGSYEAYKAAFSQCNIIEAHTLDDLFEFAKIFSQPLPAGNRVAVLTNGGGNGVLAADALEEEGLMLAKLSSQTKKSLSNFLPAYASPKNPLDIIGDANTERYEKAIDLLLLDPGVDSIVVIVLFQTVGVDSDIVKMLVKKSELRKKPIIIVSTGGEYTEMHRRILDSSGIPTYSSPSSAVRVLKKFTRYSCSIGKC